jgi:hypothetical protein
VALALAAGAATARAQDAASTATQLWGELLLGRKLSPRAYLQLDLEPRWQLTDGEEWHAYDVTPSAEYYPTDWLDLASELLVGNTRQRDGLDTFELTPRVGMRFHIFSRVVAHRPGLPGLERERLPLTRLAVCTLARLEWRNLFYSDDTPDQHQWRARGRAEVKLALNHRRLTDDRTLYATGDLEGFVPLGDDVPERYASKVRARVGLGYRHSVATRVECLYVRDWNRSAPGALLAENTRAVDLRVKLLF